MEKAGPLHTGDMPTVYCTVLWGSGHRCCLCWGCALCSGCTGLPGKHPGMCHEEKNKHLLQVKRSLFWKKKREMLGSLKFRVITQIKINSIKNVQRT